LAVVAHASAGNGWNQKRQGNGAGESRAVMLYVLVEIGMVGGNEGNVVVNGVVGSKQANLAGRLEVNNVEIKLVDLPADLRWKEEAGEVVLPEQAFNGRKA